jgi:hypothetical protein
MTIRSTLRPRAAWLAGLVIALAMLLDGGAGAMSNPNMPPPGNDAFQIGYHQGCVTGYGDAGRPGYEASYVKDAQRYAGDADYRAGWDAGHMACYEYENDHPFAGGIH